MTTSERIITLARHYCIDNFMYWSEKYQNERTGTDIPYTYSDNDYNLFPRYNTLDAILKGIETIVGSSFPSEDLCKLEIKKLGQDSNTIFTTGKLNKIEIIAIQDERQKFSKFIDNLKITQIENVEPLPYKRRLKEAETKEIRKGLKEHWNFDGGYWEPLISCSPKPFIFFDKTNLDEADFVKIKMIISTICTRIYEVNEDGYDYEIDNSVFEPDCYETIFTNNKYDWIIYGSHERTISFGGIWLLTEIEKYLTDKKQFINIW